MFEFDHRTDVGIEDDDFTRFAIDASREQFRRGDDDGIGRIDGGEIVELAFPFGIVARNAHDVFGVLCDEVAVFVDESLSHSFCVVDVDAKDDSLCKSIAGIFQKASDSFCDECSSFVDDDISVEIFRIVFAIFDFVAIDIALPRGGSPAFEIAICADANDFIGCQITVFDALFEAICVDRFSEVREIRDVVSFFRRGGHADLRSRREVIENFSPSRVITSAAAVAFVDDDEVEKVWTEGAIWLVAFVFVLILPRELVIEREEDFVGAIEGSIFDFRHDFRKSLKIAAHRLIDEVISVDEE